MTRWLLAPALAGFLAASGCVFGDGGGFARLEPGTLRVGLEVGPARKLSERGVLTDLGYHVELQSCTIRLDRVELQSLLAAGGGNARFDPANPPPGYTLCHGGHCHATDGSLQSYEEVQAKLAGGSARWEPVATVTLQRTLDLLAAERVPLERYTPLAELPQAVIARATLAWDELRCSGRVERDPPASALELEVELPLSAEPLSVPLDRMISRDGPETLTPQVRARIDGTLFDRLDFAALAEEGRVRIAGSTPVADTAIERLIDATTLTVELEEGEE